MKLNYENAMENLKAMFENFDQETIHSILIMHSNNITFILNHYDLHRRCYTTNNRRFIEIGK